MIESIDRAMSSTDTLCERLARLRGVVFVPYAVPSQHLIRECADAFSWTGTVGLQAAPAARCAIVSAPYYAVDSAFLHLRSLQELDSLPELLRAHQPVADVGSTRERIAPRRLLRRSVPGGAETYFGIDHRDRACRPRVAQLADSLDRYLPVIMGASRP